MIETNQERLTPREIARALFRHRRKMALFFCSVILLTLVVIALFPRSYSSEAKLFIQVGRETVGLDPTATTGQTMLLQKSQVDEINSALDILGSHEVQGRVVELVGAGRILRDESSAAGAESGPATLIARLQEYKTRLRKWIGPFLESVRLSDPGTETDLAINRLNKGMRIWAPKESTIITVQYRAASPELAHDIVAATIKSFLEQHLQLNRVEGSFEFFTEQTDSLHQSLLSAQSELRDRKNEFHIASMAGKRSQFEEQIKDVELQLLGAQRDLAFSEAKAADLTRAIADLSPEIVTSRVAGFANEARDGMREKLYELELQESKLRSSYQDSHPLLMQIRRQREQAEEILANLPDDRTQTTSALNSNQRALELQLTEAEVDGKALRARRAAAQQQLDNLHEQLIALNDRELQIAELERSVGILEDKYRMHVEKREQARVNDELGRGRIMNAKVAQPATLTSKPVSPNKRLLMAFGLVVATGGALGLAFLMESTDQTFQTAEQVEKELGIPIVLSLPVRKRRRRHRTVSANGASGKLNGQSQEKAARQSSGAYRELLEAVFRSNRHGDRHPKTIGIVGCDSSKLRSRVAAQLAIRAARAGTDNVLLIDADARRARVARRFHISESPGWHDVLGGAAAAESCIHRPPTENLSVMSPGGLHGNGATLTAEPALGVLGQLDEIKTEYGLVVVDLPPGREWVGPPLTADWLDEIVLVVEAERTRIQAARRVKQTLERAGVHVTGAVLANRREHIPGWLYRRL